MIAAIIVFMSIPHTCVCVCVRCSSSSPLWKSHTKQWQELFHPLSSCNVLVHIRSPCCLHHDELFFAATSGLHSKYRISMHGCVMYSCLTAKFIMRRFPKAFAATSVPERNLTGPHSSSSSSSFPLNYNWLQADSFEQIQHIKPLLGQ